MTHEVTLLANGSKIRTAKIVRKIPAGKAQVFDLEVKKHHNFFASGVNVHNCYHSLLDEVAQKRGLEELYRFKDTYLYYRTANLNVSPSSPSRRALRGKTRIGISMDEAGHFSSNDKLVNISGLETWIALIRSLNTVRPAFNQLRREGQVHVPPAIAVAISSPYSTTDPIMTLRNNALKATTSKTYTVLLETWKANPNIKFEDLADEFGSDPVLAWRDYGCRPPHSANAFFSNIKAYRGCVHSGLMPYATQTSKTVRVKGGSVMAIELRWHKTDPDTPRLMAIDAGRSKNAFTAAVVRLNEQRRLVYDLIVEILPHPSIPVDYEMAWTNVIEPIIDKMGVVALASDAWQSYALHDRAATKSLDIYRRTLKYEEFTDYREDVTRGVITLPRCERPPRELMLPTGPELTWLEDQPVAQLLRQSIIVVDVPGKTVDKPTEGNDDVFRAVVLAHACSKDPEIRDMLHPTGDQGRATGAIGVYATSSGAEGKLQNPGNDVLAHRAVGVSSHGLR